MLKKISLALTFIALLTLTIFLSLQWKNEIRSYFGLSAAPSSSEPVATELVAEPTPPPTSELPAKPEPEPEPEKPSPSSTPRTYEEHLSQGQFYFKEKFYDLAAEELGLAIQLKPDQPEAYRDLGLIQYSLKQYEHAAHNLSEAIRLGESDPKIKVLSIRSLINNGDFSAAQSSFDSLKITEDPSVEILYLKGLLALLKEDRPLAGGTFTHLTEAYPDSPYATASARYLKAYHEFDLFQDGKPAHLNALLARALNQNEEYTIAVEILRRVIEQAPEYRDAWTLLGYAHYAQDNFEAAETSWLKATEIDPTNPEAHYFLGLAYANREDYNRSAKMLKKAQENGFQPEKQIISKLAEVYFLAEDYQASSDAYERFLSLGGKENLANYTRPIWINLDHLGEPGLEKAESLAREALSLFPNEALSHNLLGWVMIHKENYPEANRLLKIASRLDPELAEVDYNFGLLFERQGNYEKAKEHYRSAYLKAAGTVTANLAAEKFNAILRKEAEEAATTDSEEEETSTEPSTES